MYDWVTAHRARYEAPAVAEDDEEAEPESALVSTTSDVDLKKLPASPKKVLKTVTALGWTLLGAQESVVHYAVVLMASDGKKKADGTQALKGDVKTAEHDKKFLTLSVVDPTHQVGFVSTWIDGKFDHAISHDPVGFPREMFFDYKPSVSVVNARGKELALEEAARRDAEYNDGVSRIAKTHKMKATEFTAWLDDWLSLATDMKEDAA